MLRVLRNIDVQISAILPRPDTATSSRAINADAFREAMSRHAASVAIVTTDGPAGRAGATVSAFSSVSDTPPTILVSLKRDGHLACTIRENGRFAVNLLPGTMEELARAFSGQKLTSGATVERTARFKHGNWSTSESGLPILNAALAVFDCTVETRSEVATHTVFFGAVQALSMGADAAILVYGRRSYKAL